MERAALSLWRDCGLSVCPHGHAFLSWVEKINNRGVAVVGRLAVRHNPLQIPPSPK